MLADGRYGWWGQLDGTTDEESIATIHRAQELDINLLDTAESYGAGHSEMVIGQALKGRRDKFIIATKVRPVTDDPHERKARNRIEEACAGSLQRLQTDHIDIHQLHAVPHQDTMPVVIKTLDDLKRQDKIRWFGISTNDADAVGKLLALGEISMLQVGFNLLNRNGEKALQLAKSENLGTLIRVPLASGALSGKYFDNDYPLDENDRRQGRFGTEKAIATFEKLADLRFLTEGKRRSMPQAALRFVLDTEGVTSAIPGTKNRPQLEDNALAASVPTLSSQERSRAIAIADATKGCSVFSTRHLAK